MSLKSVVVGMVLDTDFLAEILMSMTGWRLNRPSEFDIPFQETTSNLAVDMSSPPKSPYLSLIHI